MREIAKTKLGVGYITTVPSTVRKFLRISRGDRIVWWRIPTKKC